VERSKPNLRGLIWLTLGILLFVVLGMTFMVLLAHFGLGAPLVGNAFIAGFSAVVVLILFALTVLLLR
jgi:hypothetical protein